MADTRHLTLRERIYEEIVRMVVSGELPPGAQIDERAVIEKLSISRTPFREAIGTLAKEGLIEIKPYRGFFVRNFSIKEVNDLYELRKTLEHFAVRLTVARLTDAHIGRFETILDACVRALHDSDMETYAARDREFHELIAELSDNHALIDTLSRLALQVQMCRVIANRSRAFAERAAEERDQILAAFRARDAERAAALMVIHIADVQQSVIERLTADAPQNGRASLAASA